MDEMQTAKGKFHQLRWAKSQEEPRLQQNHYFRFRPFIYSDLMTKTMKFNLLNEEIVIKEITKQF